MKTPCIATCKFLLVSSFGWLFGHASGQNYSPAQERDAYDYFDRVGDKSFYQQQKIEFMKDEMNDYSRRLHSLQEKFNQRFFGIGSGQDYQNPFAPGEVRPPSEPKIEEQIEDPAPPSGNYRRPLPSYSKSNDSQKLAFEVNSPAPTNAPTNNDIDRDLSPGTSGIDSSLSSAENKILDQAPLARKKNTGTYLILRPGVTFPYREKSSHFAGNKSKYREYDPGFSLTLSGGYQWKGFSFGGGGLYRKNKHDHKHSYEKAGGVEHDFVSGSASSTFAGFLELGYDHRFNEWFKFYSNINLGYGVSVVEDYSASPVVTPPGTDRTRIDTTFIGSVGLGVGFHPNDHLAFLLGYRFLYEDEVPAHALEIGINGLF